MKDILGKALRFGLLATLAGGTVLAQSPPPAPDPAKSQPPSEQKQAGQAQPVEQKDTVNPKNSKEDVEAIGNRGVGKGINLYSLEREIALGKGLAQEVERSSKLIDDPVVTEYVNRVDRTWCAIRMRAFPSPSKSSTPTKSTPSRCRADFSTSTAD